MGFKVHATSYLSGYGYGVILIAEPRLSGNEHSIECHAFFSGKMETYASVTYSFDSGLTPGVSDEDLLQIALSEGKKHIYDVLNTVSLIQYQAMLAGFGFAFSEQDNNYLLQLHLRNYLDAELEQKIWSSSDDVALKSMMDLLKKTGRITSKKKI